MYFIKKLANAINLQKYTEKFTTLYMTVCLDVSIGLFNVTVSFTLLLDMDVAFTQTRTY